MKKSSMNLPNRLSIIRCLLVPVFVASIILMRDIPIWGNIIPAAIFGITAITDAVDGRIARKYNLVTDFGKFIDPLADKFMVLSSLIAILAWMLLCKRPVMATIFMCVVLVILLRELAVTSIRLVVAGKSGIVVAASRLGKIKTASQMIGTAVILLEPAVPVLNEYFIFTYVAMAVMTFTTIISGIDYLKAYMPYVDHNR